MISWEKKPDTRLRHVTQDRMKQVSEYMPWVWWFKGEQGSCPSASQSLPPMASRGWIYLPSFTWEIGKYSRGIFLLQVRKIRFFPLLDKWLFPPKNHRWHRIVIKIQTYILPSLKLKHKTTWKLCRFSQLQAIYNAREGLGYRR